MPPTAKFTSDLVNRTRSAGVRIGDAPAQIVMWDAGSGDIRITDGYRSRTNSAWKLASQGHNNYLSRQARARGDRQSVLAVRSEYERMNAGVRPISLIGAEIEYVGFGSPRASNSVTGYGFRYSINMSAKAEAAYGILYAPIPVPFLDLYGKAGVARLQTSTSGIGDLGCFPPLACAVAGGNYQRDRTDTRFGYGAGVQFKVGQFALRGEYERINASTGDPDLLSIGVLWSF